MYRTKKETVIYVLTREDVDRIDHMFGVLSMAITELLIAKRIEIPNTPDYLPAEKQFWDEVTEISGEATNNDSIDQSF